jgi:hypothetical protein
MSIRIRLILNGVVYTYVATQSSMIRSLDEHHSDPRNCVNHNVFVVVFDPMQGCIDKSHVCMDVRV